MSAPLVSIIIPCYNSEKWVSDAIQSCLDQTYSNIEIIVVDDGSTDQSVEAVQMFKDPRLKIIQQENRGVCAARNRGLSEAKGEYINYLDADDLIIHNKVESHLKAIRHKNRAIAAGYAISFRDGEKPDAAKTPMNWMLYDKYFSAMEVLIDMRIKTRQMLQTASWLIPRKVVNDAGKWREDIKMGTDYEYIWRVLNSGGQLICIDGPAVFYRVHANGKNIWSFKNEKKYTEYLYCLDALNQEIESYPEYCKRILAHDYYELKLMAMSGDCVEIAYKCKKKIEILGEFNFNPTLSRKKHVQLFQKIFGYKMTRLIISSKQKIKLSK